MPLNKELLGAGALGGCLRTFCEKCLSNRSERGAQWLKSLPCGFHCCCCRYSCCCCCCCRCSCCCCWQIFHVDFSTEIATALRRTVPIKVSVWLWLGAFRRRDHNSPISSCCSINIWLTIHIHSCLNICMYVYVSCIGTYWLARNCKRRNTNERAEHWKTKQSQSLKLDFQKNAPLGNAQWKSNWPQTHTHTQAAVLTRTTTHTFEFRLTKRS